MLTRWLNTVKTLINYKLFSFEDAGSESLSSAAVTNSQRKGLSGARRCWIGRAAVQRPSPGVVGLPGSAQSVVEEARLSPKWYHRDGLKGV